MEREIFGEDGDDEDEGDNGEDGPDMKVDDDEAVHNNDDDEELNEEEHKPDLTLIHSTPIAGPSTRPHPYHNTRSTQFHPYTRNNIKSEQHTVHLRRNSKISKLDESDGE